MSDEEYNGWSNWETWNVNLWLTNDEGVYNATMDLISQKYEYEFEKDKALQNWVEDLMNGNEEEGITKYITDNISLHRVNWTEIVESFKQTIKENQEYNKRKVKV